jgi:hypothetical protein
MLPWSMERGAPINSTITEVSSSERLHRGACSALAAMASEPSLSVFALPFSLLASVLRVLDLEPCPGEMLPPVVPSSPGNTAALEVHHRRRGALHVGASCLLLCRLDMGSSRVTLP